MPFSCKCMRTGCGLGGEFLVENGMRKFRGQRKRSGQFAVDCREWQRQPKLLRNRERDCLSQLIKGLLFARGNRIVSKLMYQLTFNQPEFIT